MTALVTYQPTASFALVDLSTMELKGIGSRKFDSGSGTLKHSADLAVAFLGEDKFLVGGQEMYPQSPEDGEAANLLASFDISDCIRNERPLVSQGILAPGLFVRYMVAIRETANYITTNQGWYDKETLELVGDLGPMQLGEPNFPTTR